MFASSKVRPIFKEFDLTKEKKSFFRGALYESGIFFCRLYLKFIYKIVSRTTAKTNNEKNVFIKDI